MMYCQEIESLLLEVFKVIGKPIGKDDFFIIDRGIPHKPEKLPEGMMGVYIFLKDSQFLKIGKVGAKSGPRFTHQHYNPKSAASTLAASILGDPVMEQYHIQEGEIKKWMLNNLRRIDILVNVELGPLALGLIESILHLKYQPRYEGFSSQR